MKRIILKRKKEVGTAIVAQWVKLWLNLRNEYFIKDAYVTLRKERKSSKQNKEW